jgi:hypothetical protein
MRQATMDSAVPGKIPPGRKSILRGTGAFVNKNNNRDGREKPVLLSAFRTGKTDFSQVFPGIAPC